MAKTTKAANKRAVHKRARRNLEPSPRYHLHNNYFGRTRAPGTVSLCEGCGVGIAYRRRYCDTCEETA